MAVTKQEMRNKVLRTLKLLPTGQDADAEDVVIVEDTIDAAQAFLVSEGVAYWETSAIPEGVAIGFRDYVAAMAAPELPGSELVVDGRAGLRDMRRFIAKANTQIKAVYY